MLLQQNHLRSLPPLVDASVITTQRNLIEVDASGTPLDPFPNAISIYFLDRVPRSHSRCGNSQHDYWVFPGDHYIPVLCSDVVTTSDVHCC